MVSKIFSTPNIPIFTPRNLRERETAPALEAKNSCYKAIPYEAHESRFILLYTVATQFYALVYFITASKVNDLTDETIVKISTYLIGLTTLAESCIL